MQLFRTLNAGLDFVINDRITNNDDSFINFRNRIYDSAFLYINSYCGFDKEELLNKLASYREAENNNKQVNGFGKNLLADLSAVWDKSRLFDCGFVILLIFNIVYLFSTFVMIYADKTIKVETIILLLIPAFWTLVYYKIYKIWRKSKERQFAYRLVENLRNW